MRKISMVWSSARSPRSSRVLAISKRFSTSASETLRTRAALISWPALAATDMTWFSSPDQRPMEERMSGKLKRSGRSR